MITEAQIKYVALKGNYGNNTKFLIDFYETACEMKGLEPTWDNIKAIMHSYKPEAITRKRRAFIQSTKEQREEELRYHDKYAHNNPSMG